MTIGVCYFPEHWPNEEWERDVEQMAEAGIDTVRMGEFAWSRIEPERGDIRLDWLAEAIDLLGEHDIDVVLCTPTATPPKWLVDEDPSILQEEADGTTREFGSRRHYCFNSEAYREETERIVRIVAERFRDDPRVVGWQTDNEFGVHGTIRCYCEDCAGAFREWLAERYGDVDALNKAWGTTFWSQHHTDFAEVDSPRHTAAEHHPSRLLDYYRFSSDSAVAYNEFQADLLREVNDDWWITHNFMGQFGSLDAYDASETLDLVSWDNYPNGFVQDRQTGEPSLDELRAGDPDQVALNHDLYRGALDRPFWVMEQQPGDVNWAPHAPQPGEGTMALWAHHAVAHGASNVLYFRWRRCREGQEQYHAGLRKQDGSPDRGYHEATRAATELDEVLDGTGTTAVADAPNPVETQAALLHDYENLWATGIQPHAADFDYWEHLLAYYRALRARGVDVDIVPPSNTLSTYDAVVAPTPYLVDNDLASRLDEYVRSGGELLLTIRSGVKDRHNKLQERQQPGPLAPLADVTVDQHETLPSSVDLDIEYRGNRYAYRTWAEWLTDVGEHGSGTTVVHGRLQTDGTTDRAAITHSTVGDGGVTYCGVWPETELADAVVTDLLDRADVAYTDRLPDGVRVARRTEATWLLNFTGDEVAFALDGETRRVDPYSATPTVYDGADITVE